MDLVYPIKKGGSKIDDAELRYSLRSVALNLRLELGELYVFGHLPAWLHGAHHVEMTDRADKALNLREKYRRMCGTAELSDPFLLLDDDHMFLQPTSEIPLHTKGALLDLANQYRNTTHGRYLRAAYLRLRSEKLPTRNYQIHYPMIITKAILRGAVGIMNGPMVMGSLYGNIVDGPTVEIDHDFRVNRPDEFEARRIGPFMSLPPVLRPEWLAFLEQTFTEPSQWEAPAAAERIEAVA